MKERSCEERIEEYHRDFEVENCDRKAEGKGSTRFQVEVGELVGETVGEVEGELGGK